MLFSEFVALVAKIVHLSASALIVLTIAAVIAGAITHKLVTDIDGVVLTVACLIVLLVWFQVLESGTSIEGLLATVCLAVVGHEAYRRLLKGIIF